MSSNEETGTGFVELWPTILVKKQLPDHAGFDRQLIDRVTAQEKGHKDLTTDYLSGNIFEIDEPAINWLRAQVNETIIEYLRRSELDYPINWGIQGWPNVNRFGDYHDYHNHPRSYLSGTYFVKIPSKIEKLHTRPDLRPGCISFYDPRYAANAWAIRGDPYIEAEFTVDPKPGLLMLWPSFLNHFVHPNLSKQPRISISFNINLKWQDHYLPDQP